MLLVLAGSILTFAIVQEATVVEPYEKGAVVVEQKVDSSPVELNTVFRIEPLIEQKFRNIVRQAYDYSCGSAALTTVLNFYLGRSLSERQVMEGLLHYGESERIVSRRAFSMLDMKRLVTALGYPSGGFRATIDDLIDLDHPAIVPLLYSEPFVMVGFIWPIQQWVTCLSHSLSLRRSGTTTCFSLFFRAVISPWITWNSKKKICVL
jgi:hypothetical protein